MSMKAQICQKVEEKFYREPLVRWFIEFYEKLRRNTAQFFWTRKFRVSIPLFILALLLITGSQTTQASDASPSVTPTTTSSEAVMSTPCTLEPIVVPTLPAVIPGYTELDPATGLHVTGKAQEIDLESYRLEITGKVNRPLSLSYDELRCMPRIEATPTLICPGFFEDTATWAGVSLKHVLELAGVQEGVTGIRLKSADGYSTSVQISVALSEKNFLAYEWEGEPVPILHGFPIRAIFPELSGSSWIKWLVKIEVY